MVDRGVVRSDHLQPPRIYLVERNLAVHRGFRHSRDLRILAGQHIDALDGDEGGIDIEKDETVLRRQALAPFRTICTRSAKRSRKCSGFAALSAAEEAVPVGMTAAASPLLCAAVTSRGMSPTKSA